MVEWECEFKLSFVKSIEYHWSQYHRMQLHSSEFSLVALKLLWNVKVFSHFSQIWSCYSEVWHLEFEMFQHSLLFFHGEYRPILIHKICIWLRYSFPFELLFVVLCWAFTLMLLSSKHLFCFYFFCRYVGKKSYYIRRIQWNQLFFH